MMMINCISRLAPGVLNNNVSAEFETFHDNLLEYPQYTRAGSVHGQESAGYPLPGHHAMFEKWRREQSIIRTLKNRPIFGGRCSLFEKRRGKSFLDELLRRPRLRKTVTKKLHDI